MCVYFVMTSLGEPADLTVKNGENLFPPILSRKQETKPCWFGMKDVFVCCVCLRAHRRCSSVVTEDPRVIIQSSHSWISWRRKRQMDKYPLCGDYRSIWCRWNNWQAAVRRTLWYQSRMFLYHKNNYSIFMHGLCEVRDPWVLKRKFFHQLLLNSLWAQGGYLEWQLSPQKTPANIRTGPVYPLPALRPQQLWSSLYDKHSTLFYFTLGLLTSPILHHMTNNSPFQDFPHKTTVGE